MRIVIACSMALVVLLAWTSPPAAVEDMGLITGGEKGTYYQFGLDLQKLVKPAGINLNVFPSKGSIENVYAVYKRPGVPMGIVQSDVLAFVARVQTDPVLQRIAKKTKMVFPLYNEEIHLLGKKGITDFDDLAGRKVAVGRDGSGTYLTARLLFKLSEVAPSRDGADRHGRSARRAQGRPHRRDVLRGRLSGEAPQGRRHGQGRARR